MKVKVTKNIIRDGTSFLGLRLSQIAALILSIIISFITIFFLYDKLNIDFLMTIVFVEIALTIGLGVIRVQGLSLLSIAIQSFKGVDKRPYSSQGVYNNEQK